MPWGKTYPLYISKTSLILIQQSVISILKRHFHHVSLTLQQAKELRAMKLRTG